MSIKHVGDAQNLENIAKVRLAQMLEKYSAQPELLVSLMTEMMTGDRGLSAGEQELCMRILSRQETISASLQTRTIEINDLSFISSNGQSSSMNLASSNFKISDLGVFEKYCEALFLTHSLALNPLDVLLANEEQTTTAGEKCRISLKLTNKFHFGIHLSSFKLHLLDQTRDGSCCSFDGEIDSINLPDGSSTVLYFPIQFGSQGKYRPTHMTCLLSGRIPLQLDFSNRGFRLNYKKKHRVEAACSLNHRMILNVPDAKLGIVEFVLQEHEPIFAWEKGIVTIRLSNPNAEEQVQASVVVLQGNPTSAGDSPLDNFSIAANGSIHRSFSIDGLQGASDLVFGIAWKWATGYRHQIVRHRLPISEGLVLTRHAVRGIAAPTSPLLVAQLLNKSANPIVVNSVALVAGDVRIDSIYPGEYVAEANANHFVSFLLPHPGLQSSGSLEVCLAGGQGRLLRFPLKDGIAQHPFQSTITVSEQALDDTCLVPAKIEGEVDDALLQDNPNAQSMWVGDIIRHDDDGLRDTEIFAGNGGYAHLRVPSGDPTQTYDIIITNS
jgi:hypothetical protein